MVIYCSAGSRSATLARRLQNAGPAVTCGTSLEASSLGRMRRAAHAARSVLLPHLHPTAEASERHRVFDSRTRCPMVNYEFWTSLDPVLLSFGCAAPHSGESETLLTELPKGGGNGCVAGKAREIDAVFSHKHARRKSRHSAGKVL